MQTRTRTGPDQILRHRGASYSAAVVSPGQFSCSAHCFFGKRALRKKALRGLQPGVTQEADSVQDTDETSKLRHDQISTLLPPECMSPTKNCIAPGGEVKSSGAQLEVGG